jgi:2,5-diketo-D-gluconate reductase A
MELQMNNGNTIAQLGLGVYKVAQDEAVRLMREAIEVGYRRIDTAALYGNEAEVGQGIRESGIDRSEVFVTTKIWNDRQGYDESIRAINESLGRLDLEYIDLLLIHWPCPAKDLYLDTWKAFEKVYDQGLVKNIGVSNFQPNHLDRLVAAADIKPVVNQVELHPFFQQNEVRAANERHGVLTEAWSPLARAGHNKNDVLVRISETLGKTVSQVIIRWHIQMGNLVIPKTVHKARLIENFDVFDFELSETEMISIASLDSGMRLGPSPDDLN